MENRYIKLQAPGCNVPLKVVPGHFATNHSHINYYIDMTTLKTRVSEAQEVARDLVGLYLYNTFVDTIVCLDGMDVVGAYLAEELTKAGVMSRNCLLYTSALPFLAVAHHRQLQHAGACGTGRGICLSSHRGSAICGGRL